MAWQDDRSRAAASPAAPIEPLGVKSCSSSNLTSRQTTVSLLCKARSRLDWTRASAVAGATPPRSVDLIPLAIPVLRCTSTCHLRAEKFRVSPKRRASPSKHPRAARAHSDDNQVAWSDLPASAKRPIDPGNPLCRGGNCERRSESARATDDHGICRAGSHCDAAQTRHRDRAAIAASRSVGTRTCAGSG